MRKCVFMLIIAVVLMTGCVAYDGTKTGVTDSYGGAKTIITDIADGFGKIFLGKKSVKVSVEIGETETEGE